MPRVKTSKLGLAGFNADMPAHELPSNFWNTVRNMRMSEKGAIKFLGDLAVFGTPTVSPKWAMAVPSFGSYYWLYSDNTDVYVWNGSTHTLITNISGTYSATDQGLWTGTLLGGVPILNNGVDPPQYWPTLSPATKLADLTNWPANTTCKSLRAFGPYLLALNVSKSGTNYPNMVKWSHRADPGTVPSSWDETDPTKDAGETELTDTAAGGLLDGVPLGEAFIVYKENSVHILRHLQNRFVFDFQPLIEGVGMLATHCAASVPGVGQIFLVTGDDILLHGAQRGEAKSLLDNKARRFLQNSIDGTNKDRSFVVPNARQKEMWFCYPEAGSTWPTVALIWNYMHDTLSFRDLANVSFIAVGVVEESAANDWDSAVGSWDTETLTWNEPYTGAQQQNLLMCIPGLTELRKADTGNTFNGSLINANLARSELVTVGTDRQGQPLIDMESIKQINGLWIRATGAAFTVKIGAQEEQDGNTYWSSEETFTPGVDKYVNFEYPISGRFLAVRFEFNLDLPTTITGYDLDLEILGEF